MPYVENTTKDAGPACIYKNSVLIIKTTVPANSGQTLNITVTSSTDLPAVIIEEVIQINCGDVLGVKIKASNNIGAQATVRAYGLNYYGFFPVKVIGDYTFCFKISVDEFVKRTNNSEVIYAYTVSNARVKLYGSANPDIYNFGDFNSGLPMNQLHYYGYCNYFESTNNTPMYYLDGIYHPYLLLEFEFSDPEPSLNRFELLENPDGAVGASIDIAVKKKQYLWIKMPTYYFRVDSADPQEVFNLHIRNTGYAASYPNFDIETQFGVESKRNNLEIYHKDFNSAFNVWEQLLRGFDVYNDYFGESEDYINSKLWVWTHYGKNVSVNSDYIETSCFSTNGYANEPTIMIYSNNEIKSLNIGYSGDSAQNPTATNKRFYHNFFNRAILHEMGHYFHLIRSGSNIDNTPASRYKEARNSDNAFAEGVADFFSTFVTSKDQYHYHFDFCKSNSAGTTFDFLERQIIAPVYSPDTSNDNTKMPLLADNYEIYYPVSQGFDSEGVGSSSLVYTQYDGYLTYNRHRWYEHLASKKKEDNGHLFSNVCSYILWDLSDRADDSLELTYQDPNNHNSTKDYYIVDEFYISPRIVWGCASEANNLQKFLENLYTFLIYYNYDNIEQISSYLSNLRSGYRYFTPNNLSFSVDSRICNSIIIPERTTVYIPENSNIVFEKNSEMKIEGTLVIGNNSTLEFLGDNGFEVLKTGNIICGTSINFVNNGSKLLPLYINDCVNYVLSNSNFKNVQLSFTNTSIELNNLTFVDSKVISINSSVVINDSWFTCSIYNSFAVGTIQPIVVKTEINNTRFESIFGNDINQRVVSLLNNVEYRFVDNVFFETNGGIYLYNSGWGKVSRIDGNVFENTVNYTAVDLFSSKLTSLKNNQFLNNYQSLNFRNNSLTIINNDPGLEQNFESCETYSILSDHRSFPSAVRFNTFRNFNDHVKIKCYDHSGISHDLRENAWDKNFDPLIHLAPFTAFDYSSPLSKLTPLCFADTILAIYSLIENNELDAAEIQIKSMISGTNNAENLENLIKCLFSVYCSKGDSYNDFITYVSGINVQNYSSLDTANKTRVITHDFVEPINWYTNRISNPDNIQDSVYAVIDLNYLSLLNDSKFDYKNSEIEIQRLEGLKNTLLKKIDKTEESNDQLNEVRAVVKNTKIYPNPFNPTTKISFELVKDSKVNVSIYNCKGQLIQTLTSTSMSKGHHTIDWNANSNKVTASGIYFYKISTNDSSVIGKMLLLK